MHASLLPSRWTQIVQHIIVCTFYRLNDKIVMDLYRAPQRRKELIREQDTICADQIGYNNYLISVGSSKISREEDEGDGSGRGRGRVV